MNLITQTLADGLVLGSGYTLLALGFALVFGVLGVLNVAHADFAVLSAYASLFVLSTLGGGLVVAIVVAVVVGALTGALLHGLVLRHLSTEQHLSAFVATLGVAFLLQYGIARVAGPQQRVFLPLIPNTYHDFGMFSLSNAQLLVGGATAVLVTALLWWIKRTPMGREIRAVSESEEAATVLGSNVARVKLITIMAATAIAGLAGVLLANQFGAVTPFMGAAIALKMFVVVLVAGMGTLIGPVLVALGLGLAEAFTVAYVGSQWQNLAGFVLLVIVLLVRPQGVFGRLVRAG